MTEIFIEQLEGAEELIDVRTPEEFMQKHIPGSKNIPLQELEMRLSELPEDPVFVCRTDNRSQYAQQLAKKGRVLLGGVEKYFS